MCHSHIIIRLHVTSLIRPKHGQCQFCQHNACCKFSIHSAFAVCAVHSIPGYDSPGQDVPGHHSLRSAANKVSEYKRTAITVLEQI